MMHDFSEGLRTSSIPTDINHFFRRNAGKRDFLDLSLHGPNITNAKESLRIISIKLEKNKKNTLTFYNIFQFSALLNIMYIIVKDNFPRILK